MAEVKKEQEINREVAPIVEFKVVDERLKANPDLDNGEFPLPEYATDGSAGLDLRAMIGWDTIVLGAGETELIPTGIHINMTQATNIAATILPRSGLGHKKGLVLGNLVGLIDQDYLGQLFISAWNRSDTPITINAGERIAQLMFIPIIKPSLQQVDEFNVTTGRGEGGFSSTGTK